MNEFFELQNPWRQPGFSFPSEKVVPRHLLASLKESLKRPEISVLIGARQVGKTFLLRQLIRSLIEEEGYDRRQIFYFNLDSFSFIPFVQNLPEFIRFIEALGAPQKISYVFLDEAQRLPNCGLTLKQYTEIDFIFQAGGEIIPIEVKFMKIPCSIHALSSSTQHASPPSLGGN